MPEPTTPPSFKDASHKGDAQSATPIKAGTPHGQPAAPQPVKDYINNPFRIALTGLQRMFTFAQTVAIVALVLSVVSGGASTVFDMLDNSSSQTEVSTANDTVKLFDMKTEEIAIIVSIVLVVGLVSVIIGAVISAYLDAAAAAVAQQQKRSFGEISKQVFDRFGGYLWLTIVRGVKTFAWSLLLIVPGIIMSIRYSLAGTAFFARGTKAVESINYSTRITKGAWMTTYASLGFFNMVTFGLLSTVIGPGVQGVLYRQYSACEEHKQTKPSADVWSVVFTVLSVMAGVLLLAFIGLVAAIALAEFPL